MSLGSIWTAGEDEDEEEEDEEEEDEDAREEAGYTRTWEGEWWKWR
jgi:hypothetical protein